MGETTLRVPGTRRRLSYLARTVEKLDQKAFLGLEKVSAGKVGVCSPGFQPGWRSQRATLVFCAIFLWLLAFHFSAVSSATVYTLAVSHLPPLRNGCTFLLATDLSGSGPVVRVRFYDNLGVETPASPVQKMLSPKGKIKIEVENYLQTAGTIVLESSSKQIVGEYWQVQENGTMFMLPLQRPGEEGRYFVNCFRFPHCIHSYIVISDPQGSGPSIQIEFYDKAGELIDIASKMLRPHATLIFKVSDYVSWDTLGKASIRSFGGSVVLHYRQLCDNEVILAAPALSSSRELFVDEFSTGPGIEGGLVITDASAEGPATKIQFRDGNGVILYEQEKLLAPNGAVLIDPAEYVDKVLGGEIRISSESDIIANYYEKNPQSISGVSAVGRNDGLLFISHFSLDNTQNVLSLLNVGQESVKADVQFYTDSGERFHSKGFVLAPYRRVDELMRRYFGEASLGTVIVESPGASLIVTSHIFDLGNSQHLGKVNAQVIR